MVEATRIVKRSIESEEKGLWNKMNLMVIWISQWVSALEANRQGPEREIENNHENGKEYAGIT